MFKIGKIVIRIKIGERLSDNQQENVKQESLLFKKKDGNLLKLYSRTRSCLKNQ